mmetsp:Transcript_6751/g.9171  ORF Transcript_6751/g.9171 Transcript_6751/m.9171 type:complete len:129 (+) Transcript_6751:80-466(+)|eukprot:CAMPEP_0196579324 /NCGR_PEP_ID=MMETSP1081-20130531/20166_1 /TAXON_ID=36882 /ORGANISM="Pyramimonas amylifera, Strain CCMP720" /LENGTH=128 /DNA_ID=CAMNT_0041898865 /DNA_START=69 /DNA_END=455 /DNA_ORIENTATION=+
MAAYLNQAKALVTPVVDKLTKTSVPKIITSYQTLMESNAKYVVKDPKAASILHKQLLFTNLSKIPNHIAKAQVEYAAWKKTVKNYQELTLTQVATGSLFVAEVYAWYCVGEIAGRGFTLSGYSVPGME